MADAVLLVGHGTVSDVSHLPEFLRRIRRGRPAPPELLRELEHRYTVIGGSPLLDITQAQAAELQRQLGLPCFVAMRFWPPSVEEVFEELCRFERVVVLPMAPFSVHIYRGWVHEEFARLAAERGLSGLGGELPELLSVVPYGETLEFIGASSRLITRTVEEAQLPKKTPVLLTAHSLPLRVIQQGDPYASFFERSARLIGERLGAPWSLAYQSQGASEGEWLGPELRTVLRDLAASMAAEPAVRRQVVVAPVGFVSDHVETLFDLEIEARAWAQEFGLELVRAPALNCDSAFITGLKGLVEAALSSASPA